MQLTWHTPDDEEIEFALQIFKELIEPTMDLLGELLLPGASRLLSHSATAIQ